MKKNFKQKENNANNKDQLILYGRHAVISAIKNPKRRITKVVITAENRHEIDALGQVLPVSVVDRKDFAKFLPQDAVHQGFALFCSRLDSYDIMDLIEMAE